MTVCPRPSAGAGRQGAKVHAVAPVLSNGWPLSAMARACSKTWRLSTSRSSSSASTSPWSTMRKCVSRVARLSGRKARAVVSLPAGWRPLPTGRGGAPLSVGKISSTVSGMGTSGRRAVFGSVRRAQRRASSQGRYQPTERCLLDATYDVERHLDRDAVVGCGWIERVVDAEGIAPGPLVGIGVETVDATTEVAAAEEFLDAQIERIGVVSGMAFPPGGEVANRVDVFGNAVVERVFERVLVDGDVAEDDRRAPDLGEHRLIMGDEGVPAAVPTVLNQRMTDEEFGEDRIDALQVDLAVRDRW